MTNVDLARMAWAALDDVPITDDGGIDDDWDAREYGLRLYEKGEWDYLDIWHDIEDRLNVSVAYLMGLTDVIW